MGFASPAGGTPLQLGILILGKLGAKCEESCVSSSPCTERLRPGEVAINRQLFGFFLSVQAQRFVFSHLFA